MPGAYGDDEHLRDAIGLAETWFGLHLNDSDRAHQARALSIWHTQMERAWTSTWPDREPAGFALEMEKRATPSIHPEGRPVTAPNSTQHRDTADSPLTMDLTSAADALSRGWVSSVELTMAALARLDDISRSFNAVISVDADVALSTARDADRTRRDGGSASALLGIPLAHKALYHRAGRESTGGARVRSGFVPTETAAVLQRLDAAGAIDLGHLHTTEVALDPSGLESHLGPCVNPWDPDVITGGSSSGSAVAVACRAVYGSLGSDTGGSVRIPAALCGVTGIKPTYGRVSRRGVMPVSFSCDHVGVLARSAQDCGLLLEAIAGHDPGDPSSSRRCIGSPPAGDGVSTLEGRRIGVPGGFFRDSVDTESNRLLEASLEVLKDLGAEIIEVPEFDYEEINALAAVVLQAEAATVHLTALRKWPDRYSGAIRRRLQLGFGIPAVAYQQALGLRAERLAQFLDTVMRDVDMLHAPVIAMPSPIIDRSAEPAGIAREDMAELTRLTRPFNYLGLPAVAVPCGFLSSAAERPIPTGFQLIGHPFSERLLLRTAMAYQAVTDWHQRQP